MSSLAARSCILLGLWLALATTDCNGDGGLLVPDRGVIPHAEARVQDHAGKVVMIPYMGEPVTLTLDASHSTDSDGQIAKFRWLSGTRVKPTAAAGAAGGGDRVVPKDAEPSWPDDVEQPSVTLDEGSYAFTLWVIDDHGLVSAPDTLRVVVATPLDPVTQACVEAVPATAPTECARCVCGENDMCREVASACGEACWGLAVCIAQSCPGFKMGDDTSCVTSRCAMFLPGSSVANMLYGCVDSCTDRCRTKL